jgi:hypothetical protein
MPMLEAILARAIACVIAFGLVAVILKGVV